MKKFSSYTWFLFLALSAIGVFLFITPIYTADGIKSTDCDISKLVSRKS